ncbi:ATP-binding protein [Streptomyces sp. NPDC019531]|uniref:sensor histidine kinase n=1 Tax=Streptomyces sp. NPDC019531 TaxID=3365062 RepID=UPI00384BAB72
MHSVAAQMLVLVAALVLLLVAAAATALVWQARRDNEDKALVRVMAIAETFAQSPETVAALRSTDPTASLQPLVEDLAPRTGVTYIIVSSLTGIRLAHTNPDLVGGRFLGPVGPALAGRTVTETLTGPSGRNIRAIVPVTDARGSVLGVVAVGIPVQEVARQVNQALPVLLGGTAGALALAAGGVALVARRLRQQTRGLGPVEITRMYEHHDAVLHAVREGVLIVGGDRRLLLANDEACRLLALPPDAEGRPVTDLDLGPEMERLLVSGRVATDEVHLAGDRLLAVNQRPAAWPGGPPGSVATLRDTSELRALASELDSVRGFAEALRSQAHEAANRLHTVVSLIELGRVDEATEFATSELELAQALTDQVVGAVAEPVLAALLIGKTAQANERGVELVLAPDSRIDGVLPDSLPTRDLVTVLGNLIDNAVDAAQSTARPRVTVAAWAADGELTLRVADSGPGVDPAAAEEVFRRGWSTKAAKAPGGVGRGLGLALVSQAVRRNGGTIEVGRAAEGGAEFTVRLPLRSEVRS